MTVRSRYPDLVESVTSPLGRALGRTGLTPNMLTTLGLVFTAVAAVLAGLDLLRLAGVALLLGGAMDALDGSLARATGRSTPFGGFYDSVSDRISDALILIGIAWVVRAEPRLLALAMVALVSASLTSYVRAKAESIDVECDVGMLERGERAVLLIIGLLASPWLFEPVLWLLAVGGTITVLQRIHHVWCQIQRDVPEELLTLALHDRAWSRAFRAAARRFYGQRNFDDAVDHLDGPAGRA